jgi:hypothetical protein
MRSGHSVTDLRFLFKDSVRQKEFKVAICARDMHTINRRIITALCVIFLFLCIGTLFYHRVEKWSYLDSFYTTGITLSTVGYGDFTPTQPVAKIFSVLLAFVGVGIVCYSITILAQHYFHREVEHHVHTLMHATGSLIKKEEHEIERAWHKTLVRLRKK